MHRVHRLERTLPSRWVRPSPGPFLALLLSLALGLIAMGSLSYAQEPPTDKAPNAEAPADNASPSRPRGPCETPRQALVTFDTYVQEPDKNPARAALCFDLSAYGISRESQLEVPEKLKTVLDARGLSFFPSQIPDKANYADPDTGRPEYTPFGPRLEEVFLRRVGDRWVFPPSVVRQISILYDNTFAFGIQRAASELPSWMHTVVLGVKVWKVVALLLCTLLCWLLAVAIQASLSRGFLKIAEQAGWSWGEEAVETSQRWIRLLLTSVAMTPLVSELMLPASMTRIVMFALQLVMTVSVVMLLWRLIDVLCNFLAARAAGTETKLDDQLIPLVRKTLKIVLVTVAVLFILQNMNVDVRSLLAGLGLGGLAIALAAKDTLANIFGSITIFADRPF
ncbi:MAG: mechanosensitive ion channel family protein, partial [Myxococcota bacterium]